MPELEMTPLIGKPARWLTNTARTEAGSVSARLRSGHASRYIVTGYPRGTEQHSADDLHHMGMVGLYDASADE